MSSVSSSHKAKADSKAIEPVRKEVLHELESSVSDLMERHKERRRLWFPSDLLPAEEQMSDEDSRQLRELPENARGLPDQVRVSLALNLLTEEGLPHFHRLIATYLGSDSVYARWNRLWTAEEDRHGALIRDYTRTARIFNSRELDRLQYSYVEAGFNPDWKDDPYRLIAYTSLQERATQWAHAKTGRLAGKYEPVLRRLLGHIAGDESRHHAFYRDVFKGLLRLDPNGALNSLLKIMPSLQMPGHSIPEFESMSRVVYRAGIYGPWQYKEIVEDLLEYWRVGTMTGLNGAGKKAQDALMALPRRLRRFAERVDQRQSTPHTHRFPFLYNRPLTC